MKRILYSSLYYHFLMRSFEPPSLFQTYSPVHFTSTLQSSLLPGRKCYILCSPCRFYHWLPATYLPVLSHLSLEVSENIWALRNSTFFFILNPSSSCHDRFSSAPLRNLQPADSQGTTELRRRSMNPCTVTNTQPTDGENNVFIFTSTVF